MHVRRGDVLKTRKDRFGVERSVHPHLDRDTRPEFILCRIAKWVPPGRTLFIASNERTPGYFSPLAVRLVIFQLFLNLPVLYLTFVCYTRAVCAVSFGCLKFYNSYFHMVFLKLISFGTLVPTMSTVFSSEV